MNDSEHSTSLLQVSQGLLQPGINQNRRQSGTYSAGQLAEGHSDSDEYPTAAPHVLVHRINKAIQMLWTLKR